MFVKILTENCRRNFKKGDHGDRYGGLIIVPGGSSLRTLVLFSTLLHSNKDKKSLKALFLNFQTFLQGTHIEPVVTHFEPLSLSLWSLPRFA